MKDTEQKTSNGLSKRATIVTMIVIGLVAGATAAFATHNFSDVSEGHTFHDEISSIAGAGITTGFPDGTYQPATDVRRQAMAAFMERGFGRTAYDLGDAVTTTEATHTVVADVTIDAGATARGDEEFDVNGFVSLNGTWDAVDAGATCPCNVSAFVRRVSDSEQISALSNETIVENTEAAAAGGAVTAVVPIDADTTETYELVVVTESGDVTVAGSLSAIYVPFGPDGDSTLTYEGS